MKYYTTTTEFNCGIDLHARQMYMCLMDRQGRKLVHTNIQGNDFGYFLQKVEPYHNPFHRLPNDESQPASGTRARLHWRVLHSISQHSVFALYVDTGRQKSEKSVRHLR
jgi:hypothetical protein